MSRRSLELIWRISKRRLTLFRNTGGQGKAGGKKVYIFKKKILFY